jgi:hypothetical protein
LRSIPERALGEAAKIIDTFRFREDRVAVIRLLVIVDGHSLVTIFVIITTDREETLGCSIEDTKDIEGILLLSNIVIPDTGVTGIISITIRLEGLFDRDTDPAKFEDEASLVASDTRLAFCLNCSILSPGLIAKTILV